MRLDFDSYQVLILEQEDRGRGEDYGAVTLPGHRKRERVLSEAHGVVILGRTRRSLDIACRHDGGGHLPTLRVRVGDEDPDAVRIRERNVQRQVNDVSAKGVGRRGAARREQPRHAGARH